MDCWIKIWTAQMRWGGMGKDPAEERNQILVALGLQHVYYVEDERHRDWNTVIQPRDIYDMSDGDNIA